MFYKIIWIAFKNVFSGFIIDKDSYVEWESWELL